MTQSPTYIIVCVCVSSCSIDKKIAHCCFYIDKIKNKKYFVVPGPLVSPAVMVCGWCKLTSDLDAHNWSSSMQICPNLHFQVILQVKFRWPFTTWTYEGSHIISINQVGSNRTSTFQMRPFSHFQDILQLDLRWPLTLVYDLWPHEHMKVPILYQ